MIAYSNGTSAPSTEIYNQALTQSCKDAAEALGLVEEQQEYFWHDALGAHVLSDTDDVTGVRYRTDIKGAGMDIKVLNTDGTEDSVATFGESGVKLGIDGLVEISPTGATPVPVQVSYEYPNTVDLSTGDSVEIDLSVIPFFALLSNGTRVSVRLTSSGGENVPAFYKGTASDAVIGWFYWLYDGAFTFTIVPQTTLPAWASTKVICYSSYTTGGAYFALGKRSGDVGILSASFGEGLIASGNSQLVVGTYNEEDATKAIIVGNGTLNNEIENRSNAFTVDWQGNVDIAEGASYKVGGTAIADYIVEQGTSGIWTYRKWASGIAECWGTYSKEIAANTVDINNYITYPFTFINKPFITTGLQGGGADLYRGQVEPSQTNASQVRLVLINKHTAAVTLYMGVHAIGRWK